MSDKPTGSSSTGSANKLLNSFGNTLKKGKSKIDDIAVNSAQPGKAEEKNPLDAIEASFQLGLRVTEMKGKPQLV
jgi:hypothetical protein